MKEQVGNVVSTQLLLTLIDSTFTSLVKTYWDHRLLPELRGRSNYGKRAATSARQTTEWGMLTIQASFPRIWDWFIYDERGERRIVLKMFVLLYNLWARMVGINQIRNTYIPHLQRNANEDVMF